MYWQCGIVGRCKYAFGAGQLVCKKFGRLERGRLTFSDTVHEYVYHVSSVFLSRRIDHSYW